MQQRSVAYLVLTVAATAAMILTAQAADIGPAPAGATLGVDCEGPAAQALPSVWLGHFSGGYSHRLGPGLPIVLDWRDETLCFPTRRTCDRYMSEMRREFHRPEGYFTCLLIR